MADKDIVSYLGATQIFVGLSSMTQVLPISNVTDTTIRLISGGTLFVGGTGITWGGAFLLGASQMITWKGSPEFYMAAAGATTTVHLLFSKSAI